MKKIYKVVGVLVAVTLLILFTTRVYFVNSRYGEKSKKTYDIGEVIECDGMEYTVLGTRLCTLDNVENTRLLCVKVMIKNISLSKKDLLLVDYTLNLNYNLLYPSLSYIGYVNDTIDSISVQIYPGVEAEIELPYEIHDRYIETKTMKLSKKDYCELDFKLYPDKKYLLLDTEVLYTDENGSDIK